MLKLYGFATSNYFNMVKHALMYKGLAFEVIDLRGCRNPDILAKSPRGKIPILGTENGFITETDAILQYLEDAHPEPPLLPAEPFARAKVRSLAKSIELYIELPARLCYVEVYFGGRATPQSLREKAQRDLLKGFTALAADGRFSPYVAGAEFSMADIYFLYSVELALGVGKHLQEGELMGDMPGAQALLARLKADPIARSVARDAKTDIPAFLKQLQGLPAPAQQA